MKKKKVLKIVFIIVFVIILSGIGVVNYLNKNLEQLTTTEISDIDLSTLKNGVYEGSFKVLPVSVKVEVTIDNKEITKIDIIDHSNGQGKPAEIITDRVIEAQSLDVDIISGATYSSVVILKAIEDAISDSK